MFLVNTKEQIFLEVHLWNETIISADYKFSFQISSNSVWCYVLWRYEIRVNFHSFFIHENWIRSLLLCGLIKLNLTLSWNVFICLQNNLLRMTKPFCCLKSWHKTRMLCKTEVSKQGMFDWMQKERKT